MADYISREAAVKALERLNPSRLTMEIFKAIYEVPAADVEPVRHGRLKNLGRNFYCSICCYLWEDPGDKTPFCPECGAKMDLEGEN